MMIWSESDTDAVTVTVPDRAALLSDLERRFENGEGFTIATLNLDHVVKLSQDSQFRKAYNAQTHVTADGNPIVWLSRLAGQSVSLVPGSELITPLTKLAAQKNVPIAFFGSNHQTLDTASENLKMELPSLQVVSKRAPAMGFDPLGPEADKEIELIRASQARLCFIALGAPKQELFAVRAAKALPNVGFVSIGAGLDFIAGTQVRAPAWVRAIAAEWVWRLVRDPGRLAARYVYCIRVMPKYTYKALTIRRQRRALT